MVPPCGIFLERLLDQHPERRWNLRAERLGRLVLDSLERLQIGRAGKGLPPRQPLVQHDAKREDVAAGIDRPARGLFRRHIGNRAKNHARPCLSDRDRARCRLPGIGVEEFGEAEIGELGVAVLRDQNVLGFDVPVHDASVVRGGKAVRDAGEQLDELGPRPPFGGGPILERSVIDEFGDQIRTAVQLADVVHGENVRVVQRGRCLGFALEPPASRRVGELVGKELDRNRSIELRVVRRIDFAHAAGAEQRDDFVGAEARASGQCHESSLILVLLIASFAERSSARVTFPASTTTSAELPSVVVAIEPDAVAPGLHVRQPEISVAIRFHARRSAKQRESRFV